MSESDQGNDTAAGGDPLTAGECPNGHLTYPTHPVCPECAERQTDTRSLADETATVVTWTNSTSTPPGVRSPNLLAIVEFDVDGRSVRAIGGVADDDVETGDEVEPVYVEQLRDPDAGIRDPDSQSWDGYRFEKI